MNMNSVVPRDPEVVGGELVFSGTRVPARTLVDYLKADHTLEAFLDDFPSVGREQAKGYLEISLEAF